MKPAVAPKGDTLAYAVRARSLETHPTVAIFALHKDALAFAKKTAAVFNAFVAPCWARTLADGTVIVQINPPLPPP